MTPTTFTCPRCGRVSHNPNDARHSYCGACHAFMGDAEPLTPGTRVRQTRARWDIDRGPHGGVLLELDVDTARVRWDANPDVPSPPDVVPADSIALEVVHVLHGGSPLCDFMRGFPSDWPPGHVWTRVTDAGVASCPKCVMRLDRLSDLPEEEVQQRIREMAREEVAKLPPAPRRFVRADGDGWHWTSSAVLKRRGGYDLLRIWNRGGCAGELTLTVGDGERIALALGLVEEELQP